MNNVSSVVESQFKTLAQQFVAIQQQAANIYKAYLATDVQTLVAALATDSTPATVSTALSKYQFIGGITLCIQLGNFFDGSAVAQSDYYSTCSALVNGDTPASQPVSSAVEAIGYQLQQLAQSLLNYYAGSIIANAAYNQNGLAQCVSSLVSLNSGIVVPGANNSAADFSNAITMVLQFINLMTNQSVFASSYLTTCIIWTQRG